MKAMPSKHPNFAQQHKEFIQQAVKTCSENSETPDMASIEKMWGIFWKMQLQKDFVKIWEKRVDHLMQLLSGNNSISTHEKDKLLLKLRKDVPTCESTSGPTSERFTMSETTLLNRLKKIKTSGNKSSQSILPKDVKKSSGVVLGEKMLSQVGISFKY